MRTKNETESIAFYHGMLKWELLKENQRKGQKTTGEKGSIKQRFSVTTSLRFTSSLMRFNPMLISKEKNLYG